MPNREWNPRAFFRYLTPEVLALLRSWGGLNLTWQSDKTAGEEFYQAWKALPEEQQRYLQTQLLPINEMCTAHARPYLEDLAKELWTAEEMEASRQWTVQDLAARLYLADKAKFISASNTYAIDSMEHFREYSGRHPLKASPTWETKEKFREAMKKHFQTTAFGGQCQVEDFVNEEKFALWVHHEDELTPFDRFNQAGVVEPQWQRPVVRLAAIFNLKTSTLVVKASRNEEREKLRKLFAELFAGDPQYFEEPEKADRFNFDRLRDERFDFPVLGIDRIEQVSVVRVVGKPKNSYVKRVTVELRPGLSLIGVHEACAAQGLDLKTDPIFGVRIQFTFPGSGRTKYRTASLFNPNSSNLNDTERGRIIRRCLQRWGIDGSARARGNSSGLGASAA